MSVRTYDWTISANSAGIYKKISHFKNCWPLIRPILDNDVVEFEYVIVCPKKVLD